MAYSLTGASDPPPSRPFASPKTHTPFSPVKERGLRYYSPETGKWVSRDPMGEEGGAHVYAFVINRPADLVDPDGRVALWEYPLKVQGYLVWRTLMVSATHWQETMDHWMWEKSPPTLVYSGIS